MMLAADGWPTEAALLLEVQDALAASTPPAWFLPQERALVIGGVWFVGPTGSSGGLPGEPAWAAAVLWGPREAEALVRGTTPAAYVPGSLALREGPMLEAAVRSLPMLPDVVLVNASGRDHPRRAGLSLHLGAVLERPTVGVTDRPLCATGPEPGAERWATTPLMLGDEIVAARLRTRAGARPTVVHPAWRTDLATAIAVVRASVVRARTPEPLRLARTIARLARARDLGSRTRDRVQAR